MDYRAKGSLLIWHDLPAPHADEMLDWYSREHHEERVRVPGFLSASRYMAVEASRALFIRYETVGAEVLSSPAYLDRLNNPTPWSLRCQPHITNNSRTVCALAHRSGVADGGFVATATFDAETWHAAKHIVGPGDLDALREKMKGLLTVEMLVADIAGSAKPSMEKQLRGRADVYVSGAILLHTTTLAAAHESARSLRALLPSVEMSTEIFQLSFSLRKSALA